MNTENQKQLFLKELRKYNLRHNIIINDTILEYDGRAGIYSLYEKNSDKQEYYCTPFFDDNDGIQITDTEELVREYDFPLTASFFDNLDLFVKTVEKGIQEMVKPIVDRSFEEYFVKMEKTINDLFTHSPDSETSDLLVNVRTAIKQVDKYITKNYHWN